MNPIILMLIFGVACILGGLFTVFMFVIGIVKTIWPDKKEEKPMKHKVYRPPEARSYIPIKTGYDVPSYDFSDMTSEGESKIKKYFIKSSVGEVEITEKEAKELMKAGFVTGENLIIK